MEEDVKPFQGVAALMIYCMDATAAMLKQKALALPESHVNMKVLSFAPMVASNLVQESG